MRIKALQLTSALQSSRAPPPAARFARGAARAVWRRPAVGYRCRSAALAAERRSVRRQAMKKRLEPDQMHSHERLAVFLFGVVFVVALLVLAVVFPEPSPFQYTVFRIVLALAAAGIAAFIPGFLEVEVGSVVKAGGAIAVFVVVYFFSPAGLVATPTSESSAAQYLDSLYALNRDRLGSRYPKGFAYFYATGGGEFLSKPLPGADSEIEWSRPTVTRNQEGRITVHFEFFRTRAFAANGLSVSQREQRYRILIDALSPGGPTALWAEFVENPRDGLVFILGANSDTRPSR